MAKKKPQQTTGDDRVPTEAPVRKGSRHKPRHMISYTDRQYDRLRQLAQRNQRPISWEARIILCRALVEAGLMSPEEAALIEDDLPDDE